MAPTIKTNHELYIVIKWCNNKSDNLDYTSMGMMNSIYKRNTLVIKYNINQNLNHITKASYY